MPSTCPTCGEVPSKGPYTTVAPTGTPASLPATVQINDNAGTAAVTVPIQGVTGGAVTVTHAGQAATEMKVA